MDTPAPASSRFERVLAALLGAASVGILIDHVARTDFRYHLWSDRDMLRSDVSFLDLPTMGAELSYGIGARIPGGAMHTLWWAVLQLRDDPRFVWMVQWALLVVGAGWLARDMARRLGALAGAMTFASLLAAPVVWGSLRTLWNPGWIPVFLAVGFTAWLKAVLDRDGRGLPLFAACVAVGATAHMSVPLLALCALPAWILARPVTKPRHVVAAVGVVVATYTPYLISDARNGWWNLRAMGAQQQVDGLIPTQLADDVWTELSGIVAQLSGWSGVSPESVGLTMWGTVIAAVGVAGALAWVRRGYSDGRLLLASGSVVALFVAAYAGSSINAGMLVNSRYLLAGAPAVALLAGAFLRAATQAAPRVAWLSASLVAAWPVTVMLSQRDAAVRELRAPEVFDYGHLLEWTSAVRQATGWSLQDVSGRTLAVRYRGTHFERQVSVPVAWLLAHEGQAFPGSLPPPCALVVEHEEDSPSSEWATPAAMAGALLVDQVTSVDRVVELAPRSALVLYATASGRCPTSFDQRYVLTPEELLTWPEEGAPQEDHAARLPDVDGDSRWRVTLQAGGGQVPMWVRGLVLWHPHDDVVDVSFHSNQLRGQGWNYGFFGNAAVRGVRVVGHDAAGAEVASIVLATGIVGGDGALTPIAATGAWPAGVTPELEVGVDPAILPWRNNPAPSAPKTLVIPLR